MTILATTITTLGVGVLLYLVYGLDHWLGLLAFKPHYLGFCVLVACGVAMLWLDQSKRVASFVGVGVFALLISPYFLGQPSARILREVLIDVRPGMNGDEVVERVKTAYQDSGYVMPWIKRDDRRIFVSLLTQHPGDCTAAIFILKDGVVAEDRFSAD